MNGATLDKAARRSARRVAQAGRASQARTAETLDAMAADFAPRDVAAFVAAVRERHSVAITREYAADLLGLA